MEGVGDAEIVLRWARAGREALAAAREEIDALNVYPVPDGDTGTNLLLTMEAALTAAESAAARTAPGAGSTEQGVALAEVVTAAAHGALVGARGNSGIILAQMLRGLADELARPGVTLDDGRAYADGLTRAADEAYRAVAEPVEGTILSVARAAAEAARRCAAEPGAALSDVAAAAAHAARDAVVHTPEQLDVLREAGVVDAGGRGLSVILDAFHAVITGGTTSMAPTAAGRTSAAAAHAIGAVPAGALGAGALGVSPSPTGQASDSAYEVMYLLEATETSVAELKATLATLGDSLVVSGGDGEWNVHVHVDDAGAAVEAGIRAGRPHRISVTHLHTNGAAACAPTVEVR